MSSYPLLLGPYNYVGLYYDYNIHCVRMKSSTQQKVSQLVQSFKYWPDILKSTTVTIYTQDPKAVWKYS